MELANCFRNGRNFSFGVFCKMAKSFVLIDQYLQLIASLEKNVTNKLRYNPKLKGFVEYFNKSSYETNPRLSMYLLVSNKSGIRSEKGILSHYKLCKS